MRTRLHNSKRSILHDLVMAAREEYLKSTTSKVTVHIADRYGSWVKAVTKNRRALNTLILPEGIKEKLISDAREFLASEEWYTWAGVPHRRGYLLYGEPGTGKSSTIHALASELGLEIYYVQLSSQGMDDHCLGRLIADTPSRCILLLEDIDCAFATRDEDEDEEPEVDMFGNPVPSPYTPMRTDVTLSGLLNVLDSVTSEEGRITFATTNHIEKLDPALIRAGRMDVKIEYKLATRSQISKTFLRFFEHRFVPVNGTNVPSIIVVKDDDDSSSSDDETLPPPTDEEIQALAESFGERIPEGTFALAQVQGYLLTKKLDARKAVADAEGWVTEQLEEKKRIQELKDKRKQKKKERMERAKEMRLAMEREAKEKEEKGEKEMEGEDEKAENADEPADIVASDAEPKDEEVVTEDERIDECYMYEPEERSQSPILISPPESA
ncbi:P-loop containing nucleoside triphosphate hydrolase protein [Schizopora paradoxa]|uniref:p-loop containing nucleoside triphosphate hydrolase protein n=1 Tax=Schizopora paradoxa TaxID=27342 RepID=A0A0H2SKH8_9AGAM|nr:P-loop containing nucleoside triphosphate hydrolase protein [Schizopora paradoxa]